MAAEKNPKKPYQKPTLHRVPLKPEEAVLGSCKSASISGPMAGSSERLRPSAMRSPAS